MSGTSIADRFRAPVAHVKGRAKDALRRLIPPHRRFVRAGEYFLAHGEREVHELADWIEPDTVAVDVGAHLGTYSYVMCRHLGAHGRIIAIEPLPDLAGMIERAARRLRLPITVINCGLSAAAGSADLRIPVEAGQRKPGFATLESRDGQGQVLRIPLRTLDEVCGDVTERISFIKIDVEGHELQVLRGGVATLKRHHPNLLIEIEQRHSPVPIDQTFSFLTSMGYEGEFLDRAGKRVPLSTFDPATHQVARADLIATPDYVSNFFFRMPKASI